MANLLQRLAQNSLTNLALKRNHFDLDVYQRLWKGSLIIRGIKKLPRKKDKRDGHFISPSNLYWEKRMQNTPKVPLFIEPVSPISANVSQRPKKSFTLAEKRIAALAVISMVGGVISFKMVFGSRKDKVQEKSPQAAST